MEDTQGNMHQAYLYIFIIQDVLYEENPRRSKVLMSDNGWCFKHLKKIGIWDKN